MEYASPLLISILTNLDVGSVIENVRSDRHRNFSCDASAMVIPFLQIRACGYIILIFLLSCNPTAPDLELALLHLGLKVTASKSNCSPFHLNRKSQAQAI